jgi:hypothetical protein
MLVIDALPRASGLEPVMTILTQDAIAAGLRELARIKDGFTPGEAELSASPILSHWTIELSSGGLLYLIGEISGHPRLADGWCTTSAVLVADVEAGTISRYYRLGPKLGESQQ